MYSNRAALNLPPEASDEVVGILIYTCASVATNKHYAICSLIIGQNCIRPLKIVCLIHNQ
jgi:hypothetical protein